MTDKSDISPATIDQRRSFRRGKKGSMEEEQKEQEASDTKIEEIDSKTGDANSPMKIEKIVDEKIKDSSLKKKLDEKIGDSADESTEKGVNEKRDVQEKEEMTKYDSPFFLTDEQLEEMKIPEQQRCVYRRNHYQQSYAISTWYTKENGFGEKESYKTTFIDLSYTAAVTIINLHRSKYWMLNKKELEEYRSKVDFKLLGQLEKEIDKKIKEMRKATKTRGCFAKLDTRSPKDAPFLLDPSKKEFPNEVIAKIVRKRFDKIKDFNDPDEVYIAFFKAMNESLCFQDGKTVLAIFVRSNRIYQDLIRQTHSGETHFKSKIILRQWNDYMLENPQYEFRCFVHLKKINAISQYFCDSFFQELNDNKEKLKSKLVKYYESIKESIPHPSFVIDFFCPLDDDKKCSVIELNPFHVGAGPCLFSWQTDRERFLNGPLQFRIVEKKPTKEILKELLVRSWENFLFPKYGNLYKHIEPKKEKCILS